LSSLLPGKNWMSQDVATTPLTHQADVAGPQAPNKHVTEAGSIAALIVVDSWLTK
jgi:hypothetical protein